MDDMTRLYADLAAKIAGALCGINFYDLTTAEAHIYAALKLHGIVTLNSHKEIVLTEGGKKVVSPKLAELSVKE